MRRLPETLVVLGIVACGSDLPLEDRPCPCAEGYTCCELTNLCVGNGASCELTLSPGSVRLRLGATQPFTATLAVTWSVDEPYGGTIDQRGEYVAPLRPGTYHVRAHTRSGSSQSVEVIVGPSELVHFLGAQGGIGNADGIGREARFKAPSSIVGDDHYLYVTDGRDAWSAYAGMGYPYPDTLGSKCVQRCAAATDPDACVEQAPPRPS